ncbi:hypothetical protein E4U55_006011, partial [Claviceps digitariae]
FTYAIVLSATSALAKKHGTPIHVLVTGNAISDLKGQDPTQDIISAAYSGVKDFCTNIGAHSANVIDLQDDGAFIISCDCAHGNTGLPLD